MHYPNGQIYCAISEGKKEYFYEDGTPKTIERIRHGRLEGEVLLYWPNGKLKRRCHFQNGVRCGADEMWDEGGALV